MLQVSRTQKLGGLSTEKPCGPLSQLPVAAEDKLQEQPLRLLRVTAEGSHIAACEDRGPRFLESQAEYLEAGEEPIQEQEKAHP